MSGNKTFTMIKPDAVSAGHIGAILNKINEAGFRIVAMKFMKISRCQAAKFYEIHNEKFFFDQMLDYMTGGPIVAAVLEKENAVADFRALIGATNPDDAEEGTIRKMFAESILHNAIHGSDSDENAQRESCFFFAKSDMFDSKGLCIG